MNPYPTQPGFAKRVAFAKKTLCNLARGEDWSVHIGTGEEFSAAHSRAMDNCFENHDGDAVVYSLMCEAARDEVLMEGIRQYAGRSLSQWQTIANGFLI